MYGHTLKRKEYVFLKKSTLMRSALQNILSLDILPQSQITPAMMLSNADLRKPSLRVVSKSGKREPERAVVVAFRTLSQARIFFFLSSMSYPYV